MGTPLTVDGDKKVSIISLFVRSFVAVRQEPEELEPIGKREFQILMALVGFAALAFGLIVHVSRF